MKIIGDSKISSKKMVRLPDELIKELNLNSGDTVVFQLNENNEILIKKGKVVLDE